MDEKKRIKKNADALSKKRINDSWKIGAKPKKENKPKTSKSLPHG